MATTAAFGQGPTSFEPLFIDRPDVSNLPATIRPGSYQFELGFERGHGKSLRELHVPNMVFRTGLNPKSELRIGYNHFRLDSLPNGQIDHMLLVMLGGKYRFLEERGSRPSVALQAEFAIPIGAGKGINYDSDDYNLAAWSFVLLFNNTLHEQVFINYNAGVFWSRADRLDGLLSASISFLHTHRLGYFLEAYSMILDNNATISLDGGIMFLVSPRVQLDAYGGRRAFDTDRLWFYGIGVGLRLDRGDMKPRSFGELGIYH